MKLVDINLYHEKTWIEYIVIKCILFYSFIDIQSCNSRSAASVDNQQTKRSILFGQVLIHISVIDMLLNQHEEIAKCIFRVFLKVEFDNI